MNQSRIERAVVPLPKSFNPEVHEHEQMLRTQIEKAKPGFELESIDVDLGIAHISKQTTITQVITPGERGGRTFELNLPRGVKPADGDKFADKFEDANPGFTMTTFEPFRGFAVMTKLNTEEIRARAAIAGALSVKPWDVQVTARKGGGFKVNLPSSYVPSKHKTKLEEVASVVIGKPGWYVKVNTRELTAEVIPGELPTFPAAYPYPFDAPRSDPFSIPIGMDLGGEGRPNTLLDIRLDGSAGALLQGLAGSGKSIAVNAIVYGVLARGHQLAILDVPHKAVDFEWCKPWVREHGWGCESTAAAVAVAQLVYTEGRRRGEVLRKHGAQKWQDLPASVRKDMPIITLVADELTGLFAADPIPKSLPKDHPVRLEAEQKAAERDLLRAVITKIPAEMRAAGIRLVLATQQAQSNTGIPPSVKINLPNRVLLGSQATKQARGHAFANPDAVPWVPEWIAEDEKAAKGVGVAEFEGQASTVFKAYYASTDEYQRRLRMLGARQASNPEPTSAQIAKFVPRLDEGGEDDRPVSRLESEGGWGGPDGRDVPEPRLRGAAAAAHALRVDADRMAADRG